MALDISPLGDDSPEPHKTTRDRAWDYTLWLASRVVLLLFIVALAFLIKVPFHRLLQKDVILDEEDAQKQMLLLRFRTTHDLALLAGRFQPTFKDCTRLVVSFENAPSDENRKRAKGAIALATINFEKLRDTYMNRPEVLNTTFEEDYENLIADSELALDSERRTLSALDLARQHPLPSFEADQSLVDRGVTNILVFSENYHEMDEAITK